MFVIEDGDLLNCCFLRFVGELGVFIDGGYSIVFVCNCFQDNLFLLDGGLQDSAS